MKCQVLFSLKNINEIVKNIVYNFAKCLTIITNPEYWDRQAFANSLDPDTTLQIMASDQGLHCLPYIQQYLRHISR